MSLTNTNTQTFTATHAKYLASKVSTDLKRMQRFYGFPSDNDIAHYEAELTEFLRRGFIQEVTYGFKRNGDWIEPTLTYTAKDLAGATGRDDDPGRISPGANVSGASFGSYMTYSLDYYKLTQAELESFINILPFKRTGAPTPGISGYLSVDKSYSSGGKGLERSTVKSY